MHPAQQTGHRNSHVIPASMQCPSRAPKQRPLWPAAWRCKVHDIGVRHVLNGAAHSATHWRAASSENGPKPLQPVTPHVMRKTLSLINLTNSPFMPVGYREGGLVSPKVLTRAPVGRSSAERAPVEQQNLRHEHTRQQSSPTTSDTTEATSPTSETLPTIGQRPRSLDAMDTSQQSDINHPPVDPPAHHRQPYLHGRSRTSLDNITMRNDTTAAHWAQHLTDEQWQALSTLRSDAQVRHDRDLGGSSHSRC